MRIRGSRVLYTHAERMEAARQEVLFQLSPVADLPCVSAREYITHPRKYHTVRAVADRPWGRTVI
jgi:hypothetical protein